MTSQEHYLKKELYDLVQKDKSIFEFLQNGSLDGIWYWDLKLHENEWMNPQFWTTLGFDPNGKKHLASEWQDLIHPEDLKVALDNFEKHCEDPNHPYDQVVRYRHKDGSTVWVRCRGIAIRDKAGKPIRMLGAHTNLTEQKTIEQALRDSEKKFKFLAENMDDIVWMLDMDLNSTYVSPSIEKALGYTAEERKQQKMKDTVTPKSFENIMALFVEELEREKTVGVDLDRSVNIEVEYFHKNGSIVWMENNVKAMRNESNEIIGMYGVSHNITERKKAQKALAEKNNLLDNILKNARYIAITTTDLDFRIKYFNPTAEKLFGYKSHEVIGKTVYEIHAKEKVSTVNFEKAIEQVHLNGEYLFLLEQKTAERTRYIDSCIYGNLDNTGKLVGYSLFNMDITAQKEAENELIQQEKLQGVLEMTGAVCHEINQPLMAITGNSELLLLDISANKPEYKKIKAIFNQSQRIGNITKKLMNITHYKTKGYLEGKIIDIDAASDENQTDTD